MSKRIKSLTIIHLKAFGGKKALFSTAFYSTIIYEEEEEEEA